MSGGNGQIGSLEEGGSVGYADTVSGATSGRKKAVAPVLEQSVAVGEFRLRRQWVKCNGARERRRSSGWCWVVGHLQEETVMLIDTRAAKRRWLLECASCSEREDQRAVRDESRTYVII